MTIQTTGKLAARKTTKAAGGQKRCVRLEASPKLWNMFSLNCNKASPVLTLSSSLLLALALTTGAPSSQAEALDIEKHQFDIKAKKISEALNAFAVQTDSEILFTPDIVKGKASDGLVGEYSDVEALGKLLKGTGLQFEKVEEKVFVVRDPSADDKTKQSSTSVAPDSNGYSIEYFNSGEPSSSGSMEANTTDGNEDKNASVSEEIVTVGSHIRGIKDSASPVLIFDREDLDRTGYATTAEFLRTLPQNFIGDGIPLDGSNVDSIHSPNLRGLGRDNTLVLINGRRMAPTNIGAATDLSSIPLNAIERIEILADGASAQYGTDAVAGVINVILKSGYIGAETELRYSDTTAGGGDQSRFSQTYGAGWDSGNFLFIYTYDNNNILHSSQRKFTEDSSAITALQPDSVSHSGIMKINQQIADNSSLYIDASFNTREVFSEREEGIFFGQTIAAVDQSSYTMGLTIDFSNAWQADINFNYGKNISNRKEELRFFGQVFSNDSRNSYEIRSLNAKMDGGLFRVQGGEAKLAIGGEYREEELLSSLDSLNGLTRNVSALFSQLFVPLVSEGNRMRGVERLEFTASARFDDYSDFGSALSPQIGLLWSPFESLKLSTTIGRSTRAPLLFELLPEPSSVSIETDPSNTIDGTAVVLLRFGANPALAEEESINWTLGLDWQPEALTGFNFNLTYTDIDYTDRIDGPGANLIEESRFTSFIQRRPDPGNTESHTAFQNEVVFLMNEPGVNTRGFTPSEIDAIVDLRTINLSATRNRSLDVTADYAFDTGIGNFIIGLSGAYLLDNKSKILPIDSFVEELNTLSRPTDLRLRGQISWSRNNLSIDSFVHYIDSYQVSSNDPTPIASDTRVDLTARCQLIDNVPQWLSGSEISLSVKNVFDRDPPFYDRPFGFDFTSGVNSAEGRRISISLTKSW